MLEVSNKLISIRECKDNSEDLVENATWSKLEDMNDYLNTLSLVNKNKKKLNFEENSTCEIILFKYEKIESIASFKNSSKIRVSYLLFADFKDFRKTNSIIKYIQLVLEEKKSEWSNNGMQYNNNNNNINNTLSYSSSVSTSSRRKSSLSEKQSTNYFSSEGKPDTMVNFSKVTKILQESLTDTCYSSIFLSLMNKEKNIEDNLDILKFCRVFQNSSKFKNDPCSMSSNIKTQLNYKQLYEELQIKVNNITSKYEYQLMICKDLEKEKKINKSEIFELNKKILLLEQKYKNFPIDIENEEFENQVSQLENFYEIHHKMKESEYFSETQNYQKKLNEFENKIQSLEKNLEEFKLENEKLLNIKQSYEKERHFKILGHCNSVNLRINDTNHSSHTSPSKDTKEIGCQSENITEESYSTNFSEVKLKDNMLLTKSEFYLSKFEKEIFRLTKENKSLKEKVSNLEEYSFYVNGAADPYFSQTAPKNPTINLSLLSLNNKTSTLSQFRPHQSKIPSIESSVICTEDSTHTQEKVASFEINAENFVDKLQKEVIRLKSILISKNRILEEYENIISDGKKLKQELHITKKSLLKVNDFINDTDQSKASSYSSKKFSQHKQEFEEKIKFLNEHIEKLQNSLKNKNSELDTLKAVESKYKKIIEKNASDLESCNGKVKEKDKEINKIREFYSTKYLNKKKIIDNFVNFIENNPFGVYMDSIKNFLMKIENENIQNFSSKLFDQEFIVESLDITNFDYFLQKFQNLCFVVKYDKQNLNLNDYLIKTDSNNPLEISFITSFNEYFKRIFSLIEMLIGSIIKENSKLFFYTDNVTKLIKQMIISNFEILSLKKNKEKMMKNSYQDEDSDDSTIEEINVSF